MTPSVPAMASSDFPWEPPWAGGDVEHLVGALDRLRCTFQWKADGLDAAGLRTRIGASSLTLGGLLKHLPAVEHHTFGTKLRGDPVGPPWDALRPPDGGTWRPSSAVTFASAVDDSPQQLYALWDGAVELSRARLAAALADGGLDQPVHVAAFGGTPASLRRLVFALVEESGRHPGHADLLREAVDGRVGEDPPAGWRPSAGAVPR